MAINDSELAAVRRLITVDRAFPAIIVRAIVDRLDRLDRLERALCAGCQARHATLVERRRRVAGRRCEDGSPLLSPSFARRSPLSAARRLL